MRTIFLDDLLRDVRARKAELGIADTEATTETMRNKGAERTPEKRELLRRIKARAEAAGVEPIKACF